jgi:hypothetical protein
MEGTVMAPLTMCAAERSVVLVYTSIFVRSRYGGWFALRPLVCCTVQLWIERRHCNHS